MCLEENLSNFFDKRRDATRHGLIPAGRGSYRFAKVRKTGVWPTSRARRQCFRPKVCPRCISCGSAVMWADSILEEVYSAKFLGILLDRGLTWNNHIDHSGIDCGILWANSLSHFLWGGVVGGLGRDIHGYVTRGRDNYRTGRNRTVVYEHLPSQAGVHFINRLPNSMKHAQTPKASKARLKRFLVSKAFYSVDEFLAFNWETAQFDN
ncbi:hypothetical protein J6590_066370 [Homalodisca vitripennis]|nr:hypothetical protein J6590_066370 [Homalodisca vitripennis]